MSARPALDARVELRGARVHRCEADAPLDGDLAVEVEIPVTDAELASGGAGAARSTLQAGHARRREGSVALEQRVAELEERLQVQEIRCCEHAALSRSHGPVLAVPPCESDQLVEFFLTEMEKHQTVTAKLSIAHVKLQQELHEHQQLMQRLEGEQSLRLHKYLEVLRQVEKEFARGEKLREEEKRLTVAQSKKRLDTMKRAVDDELAVVREQSGQEYARLQEALEKRFVDVVMENQTLKAENMDLRDDLQHVSAMARSNKKTLRFLTEELLKLKSTTVMYPTELDELVALRSVKTPAYATRSKVFSSKQ